MDVVFCTDNNYVMACGVAMVSLLDNNKENAVTIHILGIDLKTESKEKCLSIASTYNVQMFFYEIDNRLLESHKFLLLSKQMTLAAFTRLFLGSILPSTINKVLYLDCDLIISKNLLELWNTNIDEYSIAGVIDVYLCEQDRVYNNLGYDKSYSYVNSGVLLINLKYWREQNLQKFFLEYEKEYSNRRMFHDQDIINGVLYNTKLLLPLKYNIIESYYLRKTNLSKYKNEIYGVLNDPVIIHYSSSNKPWYKSCMHPLKGEFLKYKAISPWKDTPLTWGKMTKSDIRKHYIEKISRAIGLRNRKYLKLNKLLKSI